VNKLDGRHIVQLFLFLIVQIFLLNNIELHGTINPFVYPLFILLLPIDTPKSLSLLLAFIMGLTIDIFSNTPGLHASATVFLAFLRPYILNRLEPNAGYGTQRNVTKKTMGWAWFLIYAILGIAAHHFFYFFVEVFTLAHFTQTIMRVFASALVSMILVFIHQSLLARA